MLKLHGFPVSNYYNVVKTALLEKGQDFEEVLVHPGQGDGYLAKSPMGKVPCLETEQGFFGESQVALDYLEEACPEPALYPADPFQRAKVRELMRVTELYLELPARRLYREAFFGGKISDETKEEVKPLLQTGLRGFLRLARFEPYLAGDMFTHADIAAASHLPLIHNAYRTIYGEDLWNGAPQIEPYLGLLRGRPTVQKVMADRKAGVDAFLAQMRSRAKD